MIPAFNYLRLGAFSVIVSTAALCVNGCDDFSPSLKRPNMTSLSPQLQSLFEKTKTVCFGRFIVEVPATATVVYGPASLDAPIQYFPGEAHKVDQHVAAQLLEVEQERKFFDEDELPNFPLFGKVIEGVIPGQRLVFGSKSRVAYTIHSYVPVGKDLFVQNHNIAILKDETIAALNHVASNLRNRPVDQVPAEFGTCIDGGFVAWQPEYEQVTVGIRLKEFPDVHFSIEALKNQKYLPASKDLDVRLKDAEKDGGSWYARITFFRRGPRQLGEWKGFEALALKPAQENLKESHEFHFISLGAPNAPLQPQLDIQLDTGASGHKMGAVKPSLSNEEAVALWDKLTSTIRVRPQGGNKTSATEPTRTPLATLVGTGATCPQTGWWQCTESDNVEGGRRRHFTANETMPHAILLGEPNLWQKLSRDHPRHKRATVWQLVDYGEVSAVPVEEEAASPLVAVAQESVRCELGLAKDNHPSKS